MNLRALMTAGCCLIALACGSTAPHYTVGGTVTGLIGTLVLSNNGADYLTVTENGSFSFRTALEPKAGYTVSVFSAPSGQFCTVVNGTGIATHAVNDVSVTCATSTIAPNMAASFVVGQPDFDSSAPGTSATLLSGPSGSVASNGNLLFTADAQNNRVAVFALPLASNGIAARFVLGQKDSNSSNHFATSANTFMLPVALSADATRLAVADFGNNRVLIYGSMPTAGTATPSIVLGQSGFSTSTSGCDVSSMFYPLDVRLTPNGRLIVVDTGNNRVLLWNSVPSSSGAPADIVLGQPDLHTCDTFSATGSTLSSPGGVWSDGNRIIVTDSGNNRVLLWNAWPGSNQQVADIVLGQQSMTSYSSGVGPSSLSTPAAVVSDGTHLFVADQGNNRVLYWSNIPTVSGSTAALTFGQPDFVSSNAGTSNSAMSSPSGVTIVGTKLFVTDTNNSRVLVFDLESV